MSERIPWYERPAYKAKLKQRLEQERALGRSRMIAKGRIVVIPSETPYVGSKWLEDFTKISKVEEEIIAPEPREEPRAVAPTFEELTAPRTVKPPRVFTTAREVEPPRLVRRPIREECPPRPRRVQLREIEPPRANTRVCFRWPDGSYTRRRSRHKW